MPDEKSDGIRPFVMKVRCKNCDLEGEVSSGEWPIRIKGTIELLCLRCGKKTEYEGIFGHDIDTDRQVADLRRSGFDPSEEGEKRDGD